MTTRMMQLTFVVSLLFLLIDCKKSNPVAPISPAAPALDSTINGQTLAYPRNQRFSLQLDLWADAGYLWDISMTDTTIMRVDSTCFRAKSGNPNQIGGLTIETFYFCTMNSGQSLITLAEHHPWQRGVRAIDSLAFTITVSH